MSTQILPQTPNDILLWDDGIWCYAHENHIKGRRKQEPRRIPAATSEWYQLLMGVSGTGYPGQASCASVNNK